MAKLKKLPGKLAKEPETLDVSDLDVSGGIASPAISLLSKAKVLENLLNHIEDLKGTPFQAAAEALAEKAPWVFGHVDRVRTNLPKEAPYLGVFQGDPVQYNRGVTKGRGVGTIGLNPHAVDQGFQETAADTLGHEATHAAQALSKGLPRFVDENVALNNKWFGYQRNPYEKGARKAGANLRRATEGKPRIK